MILFMVGCSLFEKNIESTISIKNTNYKYVDKLNDKTIFHVHNKDGEQQ